MVEKTKDDSQAGSFENVVPPSMKGNADLVKQFASLLVQGSEDAIIAEDLEGNIISWNPAAERMFGYTADEIMGKPMEILGTEEKKKEFDELIEKVKKGEKIQRYETVRKHKNGKKVLVSVTISPMKDKEGNIVGLSAIDRNITLRKENAGYARSLIEASVDPLVTISQDGKITDVNEATVKATGATRKELVGSVFSDYFTEPEKAEEGYKKVLKEGTVRDYPLTIKHKNGKLMDVLYNASTYKDAQGKVIGVFAAARDITEQKQASQYARSLIEASLDPLVTISPDGKITDVNEATIKATGATRTELVGSVFSDYFTEPEKAEEGYQTVLEKGSVSDYALTIKSKDGKLMDVLYNASVYKDDKGKVIGVFAAARDVTKSRQASQYARSLIEASVDPLVTISPDGKITDVNEATIQATGATKEELVGSVFSDYFTEPAKAESGYKKVLSESVVRDYPLTIKHKNGKLMDVLYNASVYKDVRGKVIGVFAAARDVTEQKQASQYARSLIEASLDPLVTISPEGKITDVNQATIDVTGVTRKQLIDSDFSFYFTEPDKARSGYQEAFKKGEVRDYLLTIRSKTGKETPVLYNASVYKDEKGKVLGVFAAAREISRSELKAAKARELQRVSKKIIFKVVVSRKLSSGNVKLSEKDATALNIDMVDNVTVRPTREDIAKNKVTAMSITDSRLPASIVLVSMADARKLGVEENDTAFVAKAGTEEEVELVDVESYAAKPGEYDTANASQEGGKDGSDDNVAGGIKAAPNTGVPLADENVGESTTAVGESTTPDVPSENLVPEEEAIDQAKMEDDQRDKAEEMAKDMETEQSTDAGENVAETSEEPPTGEPAAQELPAQESVTEESVVKESAVETPGEAETSVEPKEPVQETPTTENTEETPAEPAPAEPVSEKVSPAESKPKPKKSSKQSKPVKKPKPAKKNSEKSFEDQIDALRGS